jgi:hypothetical protein
MLFVSLVQILKAEYSYVSNVLSYRHRRLAHEEEGLEGGVTAISVTVTVSSAVKLCLQEVMSLSRNGTDLEEEMRRVLNF